MEYSQKEFSSLLQFLNFTINKLYGAEERTRTFTGLPLLRPERSASTNSATSAKDSDIIQKI